MARQLVLSPRAEGLRTIVGSVEFGYTSHITAALPERLYTGLDQAERPASVINLEADLDLKHLQTPAGVLGAGSGTSSWPTETRQSIARLEALWLLAEDRHRLLDVSEVEPLAHQASLVEHVLSDPALKRVLIADEVGLGKTVEAALIIQRLLQSTDRQLRVLYLTEARLVDGVHEEFKKVGISLRRWTAAHPEARLDPVDGDPLVVASIHRAVFSVKGGVDHFATVAKSGPWDVLVVDEAHHLSDWSPDGGDPQERMRLIRTLVSERLKPDGRLLLLSGTPHQGHESRFVNVLRLLDPKLADHRQAKGRLIYRIKDDIQDWEGNPLFPGRKVEEPTVVDVPQAYTGWMSDVYELLTSTAGSRAGTWRRAQALQWCASSPEAGLAYLVRLALRLGHDASRIPELKAALLALRPWRGGAADEGALSLQARMAPARDSDLEDEEPDDEIPLLGLRGVLASGTALVKADALKTKMERVFEWLDRAPDEKFVVFAQPVETVYALRDRLERRLGAGATALIVGGQDDDERRAQIKSFQGAGGARVLVSSRSGGEGINLQVSRRLIHFDVPWNPMELEQRVGRVHRYGSVSTILVHTLVLRGSREEAVLARCRARLGQIIRDVDRDRFETLFARTMSLVPLQELEQLMTAGGFGPLDSHQSERLDTLVKDGFERWSTTDREFRAQQASLGALHRGPIRDADLSALVVGRLEAKPVAGYRRRTFRIDPATKEPVLVESPVAAFELPGGATIVLGRDGGVGLGGPAGSPPPRRVGLNDPTVAGQLRSAVQAPGAGAPHGAGSVLMEPALLRSIAADAGLTEAFGGGFCLLAYVVRWLEPGTLARELWSELRCWALAANGGLAALSAEQSALLVRAVRDPRPKRVPPKAGAFAGLQAADVKLTAELRRMEPGKPVPAVFPIAAIAIEPG